MERTAVLAGVLATALLVPLAARTTSTQDPTPPAEQTDPIAIGTLVDVHVRKLTDGAEETFRGKLASKLGDWVVLDTGSTRVAMNREQIVYISTVGR